MHAWLYDFSATVCSIHHHQRQTCHSYTRYMYIAGFVVKYFILTISPVIVCSLMTHLVLRVSSLQIIVTSASRLAVRLHSS